MVLIFGIRFLRYQQHVVFRGYNQVGEVSILQAGSRIRRISAETGKAGKKSRGKAEFVRQQYRVICEVELCQFETVVIAGAVVNADGGQYRLSIGSELEDVVEHVHRGSVKLAAQYGRKLSVHFG